MIALALVTRDLRQRLRTVLGALHDALGRPSLKAQAKQPTMGDCDDVLHWLHDAACRMILIRTGLAGFLLKNLLPQAFKCRKTTKKGHARPPRTGCKPCHNDANAVVVEGAG